MGKHITHHKKVRHTSTYCDNKSKAHLVSTPQVSPKLYKQVSDFISCVFWLGVIVLMVYLNMKN